jgi:uncharacterized protein DUF4054
MSGTGAVVFDYDAWGLRYPELVRKTPKVLAQAIFNEITVASLLDNTSCSRISDLGQRAVLLNMLVAHVAKLNENDSVGRVSNATKGSVTVALDYSATGPEKWYAQTKYGAQYWASTRRFRKGRYYAGPTAVQNMTPRFPYGWPQWR